MIDRLPRLVARVPANVHVKLLAAFLAMVLLLIALGAVGLQTLTGANRRADELLRLQRNIATYSQLQNDATEQLYTATAALLDPEEGALETALRQLNQFGYDVERLQVAAPDDVELLGRVQADYRKFVDIVKQVVERIRLGQVNEGRLQLARASPLANRLERQMNELVNRAEAEMLQSIDDSHAAFFASRWTVIGLSTGSIALALILGYAISASLIVPVKAIDARLSDIAAGDFRTHVDVINRDELGTLAVHVNAMNDKLGDLYRQLEAANGQLRAADRLKSQFIANMSHELRTPLNAIIGFSQVLAERLFGELNGKQLEYAGDINAAGRHLLALINEILDMAKINAGRMVLDIARLDVAMLIDSAVPLVRERARRKNIALEVAVAAGLPAIDGDGLRLKQVLIILLDNALKFTPEGGRIEVRAAPGAAAVELSVADSGVGINAADQAVIFDEFRQAADSGARHEGTGLGLALARKFVELHGGSISVRSEAGRGATFSIELPVTPCPTS